MARQHGDMWVRVKPTQDTGLSARGFAEGGGNLFSFRELLVTNFHPEHCTVVVVIWRMRESLGGREGGREEMKGSRWRERLCYVLVLRWLSASER